MVEEIDPLSKVVKKITNQQNASEAHAAGITVPQCLMLLLILTLWIVVLATFRRYGFTTDEDRGLVRAERIFAVFSSGRVAASSEIDLFHGAAPDLIALLLQKFFPTLSYDSRHLVFAVFGIAGIYYVYAFASRWLSEWTGLFAALFLAATPMWFGYMFNNHKDIPFATLLLASTHYSLLALTHNFVSRSLSLKTGAAIGLLAGTKLVGLLVLPLIVAVFLGFVFFGDPEFKAPKNLVRRVVRLVAIAAVGCVVGLTLFFPQLFFGRVNQLGASTRFTEIHKWTQSKGNDRYYAERYFIATTPIFMLVLGTVGMLFALYRRNAVVLAAGLIFGLAFLFVTLSHNRVYDGCRHFLFVYPYFMIVAAYPVSALLVFNSVSSRTVVSSAVALCVVGVVLEMYRLFPYQSSYYNSLVGGIEGADGVYEIDMWRSAHREALKVIASSLSPGETVRVYSCGARIDYLQLEAVVRAKTPEEANYFITLRRGRGCSVARFGGRPVVSDVRRGAVLFATIYKAQ